MKHIITVKQNGNVIDSMTVDNLAQAQAIAKAAYWEYWTNKSTEVYLNDEQVTILTVKQW